MNEIKKYTAEICTIFVGLFFILILHIKLSYTLFPLLLSVIGLVLLIPIFRQRWLLDIADRAIIISFIIYFLLFLFSVVLNDGRGRELDLASRSVLLLPVLALCYKVPLKQMWIIYTIVISSLIAGIVAIIQFFILKLEFLFPAHMYIQAGGIIMTLSALSFVFVFYFQQKKDKVWLALSIFACLLGLLACVLNKARGPWITAPLIFITILWFNRHLISKWFFIALFIFLVLTGILTGDLIIQRWEQAVQEINQYFQHNNGSTSVGARLDMWKSALMGIQEKPLFGWGLDGVKQMRQLHFEQGLISEYAAGFDHAHNQYLHDASARGLLGLISLFSIFLIPLTIFIKNLKKVDSGSLSALWSQCGIVHIISVMGYCLTQGFLSHNSGVMFYFFCVILFLGLQKISRNKPLM